MSTVWDAPFTLREMGITGSLGFTRAAVDRLRAFPGEGCVLTVVLSAHVVPGERVHMTPGRVRERERIRGGMAGVLEPQLGIGVQALGALGRHVDEIRRLDGPFR